MGKKPRFLLLILSVVLFVTLIVGAVKKGVEKAHAIAGTINFGAGASTALQYINQKTVYTSTLFFGKNGVSGALTPNGELVMGTSYNLGAPESANVTSGFLFDMNNGRSRLGGASIGTTDTTNKLEVVGTGPSYGDAARFQGNVGIGKDVAGPFDAPLTLLEPTPGQPVLKLKDKTTPTANTVGLGMTNKALTVDKALNVNGTDNSTFAGNVGIGTNNPTTILELSANDSTVYSVGAASKARIRLNNTNTTDSTFSSLDFASNDSNGTTGLTGRIVGLNTNHGSGSWTGEMQFLTRSGSTFNESMRINSAGNVGIGQTLPNAKLDIGGASSLIANTSGNLNITPNTNLVVTQGSVGIGSSTPNQKLDVVGSAYISANLGIGTTTPGSKLDITYDSTYNGEVGGIRLNNATVPLKRLYMGYDNNIDAGYIQAVHSGNTYKNIVINAPGGNVAIGQTAAPNKLQVNGNMGATGWVGAGCEGSCESAGGYALMYADGHIVNTSYHQAQTWQSANNLGEAYAGAGGMNANSYHAAVNDTWLSYPGNNYNYLRGLTYAFNNTWYDESNSAYYVDPNNTTRMNNITPTYLQLKNGGGYNMYSGAIYGEGVVAWDTGSGGVGVQSNIFTIKSAQDGSGSMWVYGTPYTRQVNSDNFYANQTVSAYQVDAGRDMYMGDFDGIFNGYGLVQLGYEGWGYGWYDYNINTYAPNVRIGGNHQIKFGTKGVRMAAGGGDNIPNSCGGNWYTGIQSGMWSPDYSTGCGDEWILAMQSEDGAENSRLILRVGNDATDDVFIRGTGGTTTGTGDLAEMYYATDDLKLGDVVAHDPDHPAGVKRATQADLNSLAGVTSAKPFALLMSQSEKVTKDEAHYKPISLAGKIIVRISLENGPVKAGDPLTISSTPGYAMKAVKAGMIIGRAHENFDGSELSSAGSEKMYSDISEDCPGCDAAVRILPKTAKAAAGTYQKGSMVMLVNVGWYDPDMSLTASGDLKLAGADKGYEVRGANNSLITRIGAFAELVVSRIRAGVIEAKTLIVNGVDILKKLQDTEARLLETQKTVEAQGKQIEELKKALEELKK